MATKTIRIDLEAYRRLRLARRENESFSQAIKRIVRPRFDAEAWIRRIHASPMSEPAAAAVEEQIRSRRGKPQRTRRAGRAGRAR